MTLFNDPTLLENIEELLVHCGGHPGTLEDELISQMILNSLKLLKGEHDTGQIKLMNRALKEMRYAFRIFNGYPAVRKVSIFGSARTPVDHADYVTAREFSAAIAEKGWMCITGGAHGIMRAGLEGQSSHARFGLSIRLPFENSVNDLLEGDTKAIIFRYFFTRKLMFMSHSDAIVVFPGGVGTMDELFEALTLMQTGKGEIVPVVLLEGTGGDYWKHWQNFIQETMLSKKMIDEADLNFYYRALDVSSAIIHLETFYKKYHSSRYVGDNLVIRLQEPLQEEQVNLLNEKFSQIIASGQITQCPALPEETEYMGLPRLVFRFVRRRFGLLRALIDQINAI